MNDQIKPSKSVSPSFKAVYEKGKMPKFSKTSGDAMDAFFAESLFFPSVIQLVVNEWNACASGIGRIARMANQAATRILAARKDNSDVDIHEITTADCYYILLMIHAGRLAGPEIVINVNQARSQRFSKEPTILEFAAFLALYRKGRKLGEIKDILKKKRKISETILNSLSATLNKRYGEKYELSDERKRPGRKGMNFMEFMATLKQSPVKAISDAIAGSTKLILDKQASKVYLVLDVTAMEGTFRTFLFSHPLFRPFFYTRSHFTGTVITRDSAKSSDWRSVDLSNPMDSSRSANPGVISRPRETDVYTILRQGNDECHFIHLCGAPHERQQFHIGSAPMVAFVEQYLPDYEIDQETGYLIPKSDEPISLEDAYPNDTDVLNVSPKIYEIRTPSYDPYKDVSHSTGALEHSSTSEDAWKQFVHDSGDKREVEMFMSSFKDKLEKDLAAKKEAQEKLSNENPVHTVDTYDAEDAINILKKHEASDDLNMHNENESSSFKKASLEDNIDPEDSLDENSLEEISGLESEEIDEDDDSEETHSENFIDLDD